MLNPKAFLLFFTVFLFTSPVFSFTPMEYYNSFVAGFDKGYRDGAFDKARFNKPVGIAFSTDGHRLFVADWMNNRIRVVHLDEGNRVDTLAGTGKGGPTSGLLLKTSMDGPVALVYLPTDALVVYCTNDGLLQYVDLKTNLVSTLAQVPQVWNLAYCQKDNAIYFSEPLSGAVQKLDLTTKKISTVLSHNPKVPQPFALCVGQDHLYVADSNLSNVYQIDSTSNTPDAQLSLVGAGNHIFEMTYSDGILYALQYGSCPLARITPTYKPVTLATAWGNYVESDNPESESLFYFSQSRAGFAASPIENRKFFISSSDGAPSIISVKDYDFGNTWQTSPLPDFDYPAKKPPNTFRILMVGDSRLLIDPIVVNQTAWNPSLRTNTCAKQLEFWLNTEASLQNVNTHYEVLTLAHTNENALFFANYEVPSLVKKYDIDLVVLFSNMYFSDYFEKPLSPEGIPVLDSDPKFLSQPPDARIPPGVPGQFYQYCKKIGLIPKTPLTNFPPFLRLHDPVIRADLLEMLGLPLRLLSRKLDAIQTQEGQTPQLAVLYIPWDGLLGPEEDYDLFWKELCEKNDVKFVSVGEGFDVLRTSFYPTSMEVFAHHYTAYGQFLIAFLLEHYLIQQKLIPFK